MSMEPDIPSIFDELEQQRPLVYASAGQRFINFLVDTLVIAGLNYVITFLLMSIAIALQSDFMNFAVGGGWNNFLPSFLYGALISSIIYGLTEGIFKGRTLGKLLTGTRAVREDGSPITMRDAFTRSICRQIPFETFSAFSSDAVMWHDRLSKTRVIKVDLSR